MKIIYCNGNFDNIKDPAILKLKNAGHEVIFYDLANDQKRKNLWYIRHFQMYEEILDLATNVDILYFSCPIGCPEVLIYDLKTRSNFKAKIVSNMMFREVNRSLSRAMAIRDLIDMPQFGMMVFGSMIIDNLKFPENLERVGIDTDKIMLMNEPFNEDPELFKKITRKEARDRFKIKEEELVLLNSGSWNYIKGADIFVEALKYIPSWIKVLLHKNRSTHTDPTLKEGLIKEAKKIHSNIIIIEEWIEKGEMPYLYIASDVVVCPHRKLYEYSMSGIPNMAALAKKPIVAPDFYFFNEIIKRFKVGITYFPENPLDMALSIAHCFNNYDEIIKEAKFEESLTDYVDITDTPLKVLEKLKI